MSLAKEHVYIVNGWVSNEARSVCVRVCLCALDELLKPLDTACNTLHLSSLRLNGKDNEKCVFVFVCCYGAVWWVFSMQVVIDVISL